MDLGIHFGQGFFLARPNNPVSPIYEEARSIIKNKQISSYKQSKSVTVDIHDEIVLVEKGSIVTRKMARDLFQV